MNTTPVCAEPTAKYPNGRTGTTAGVEAHRKAKEPPCEPCRLARNAAVQSKYVPTGKPVGPPKRQTPEGAREVRRQAAARWRANNPERARELSRESDKRRDVERRRAGQRRRATVRRQKIAELKSRPCADCGVQYPPYVMQFDHLGDEPKLFSIGRMTSRTWESILAEIAKCDVVCANCHMERTHQRRNGNCDM